MKASDLMIGDWVFSFHAGRNIQIRELLEDSVVCSKNLRISADENIVIESYDNISPIQLTEEILEKNGFKKKVWWKYRESDVTTYAIGEGFHIELSENEFWLVDNCSDYGDYGYESNWIVEVKYVHELQHILRLCKIEKEIIL